MVNAEDEVHFDMRSSCTNHEAVIKIMGGMRGSIRKPLVDLDDPFVQLEQVVRLNGSLETFFNELRETARQEFIDELSAGVETFGFIDKEYAVKRIDALFEDFMDYLMAIDDEVAKGNGSALRIDQFATEKSGTAHISLNSLRRWVHAKFEISIEGIEYGVQPSADSSNEKTPESGVDAGAVAVLVALAEQNTTGANAGRQPRRRMRDQEEAILKQIVALGFNPRSMPKLVPGKRTLKVDVLNALSSSDLFSADTSFENAWERLSKYGDTAFEDSPLLPINK